MRHHVIISGTGRSGTSFLVELLTRLGLDTGFHPDRIPLDPVAHAGLEHHDLFRPPLPYIVKSPWLTTIRADALAEANVKIDHAIIPIRQFVQAAASRIHMHRLSPDADCPARVAGGLWMTEDPEQQLGILHRQFAELFELLAENDIPVTILWYPRLVQESRYLFDKLQFLLETISWEKFDTTFRAMARPEWVHDFSGGSGS